MEKIFLYSAILILVTSCEKDYTQTDYPVITEYKVTTMFYPSGILPSSYSSLVKLDYNSEGEIVKRIGALIEIGSYTGFNFVIFDRTSDSAVYRQKTAKSKQLTLYYNLASSSIQKMELLYENDHLVKKINERNPSWLSDNDTTLFIYNSKKQIIKMKKFDRHTIIDSKLCYDEKGNLTLITSEAVPRINHYYYYYKDTSAFLKYDNTPNLTKKLIIFDECFLRSLSTNNFADYSYKKYNRDNMLISSVKKSWQFQYDENNYLIY